MLSISGYEDEYARIFEPTLAYLPSLSYETMKDAYIESLNVTRDPRLLKSINKKTLRSLAFQVNVFCNDTFEHCKYRDEEIKCCDHFLPVYSEHGFCYAFNPRYIDSDNSE